MLAPFDFYVPAILRFDVVGSPVGVLTSVFLFVPLGFLYPLTWRGKDPTPQTVAILGAVVGTALAAGQACEANHRVAVATIVASGIGAGIGAMLLELVNDRIRASARLAGRLSLELPLVALIYLLVPLVLATSLAVGNDALRAISLVPLTLLGARLLSAVQEHHFAPAGVFQRRQVATIGAVWTALGVFPLLRLQPIIAVGLIVLIALTAAHESTVPAIHGGARERRFEVAVLRSAVPYIAVYFAALIFLPLSFGLADWRMAVGLTGSGNDLAQQMVRSLEPVTAIAMLGYILAEARGRRELAFRRVAVRITVECAFVAIAIEGSRGFQRGAGASVSELALMIVASLVGTAFYHSQRERIRRILIQREPTARVRVAPLIRPRAIAGAAVVRWTDDGWIDSR